ncbi:class I SAM-dependent methyltransferase [Rhodobacteraceae bacterium NNCM2]|nr:class I SAM-dependent methyltransferase [Coraliihabitans acroporae]
MSDRKTLDFYSTGAGEYANFVGSGAGNPWLAKFMEQVRAGGAVLDFGCGHGWATAVMREAGFDVTAMDGSSSFAVEAKERFGLDITVATFDELDAEAAFDGLWVSFSLLHDTAEAFPKHLRNLRRAAKPGAVLYLGLKEGEGTTRDRLGRFYTYFSEDEVRRTLAETGWGDIRSSRRIESGLAGADDPVLHIFATAS